MKRIYAILVTLCIALASFAQGSVTVTQSSAISDLVNNKQSKPQTTQPKPQTPAQQKPQAPAQPKPQTQAPVQPKPQTPATTPAQPQAQQPVTAAPTGTISGEGGEATEATQSAPRPVVHQYSGQQPRRVPTGSDEEIAAMVKHRGGDYTMSDGTTGKKVMRGAHKIKGWRIQVYNGGNKRIDREKAEELGQKVKKHYPGMPVYVHFYSPRWMTMCGNFVTHKDAEPYKTRLLNLGFKNVSIVRQQIVVE